MATPLSVKSKWTAFDGFAPSTFKDDFCHENQFTWKSKAVSTNGATIRYKQNLNYHKTLETKDELRFWFPVENNFYFVKVDNNSVKLHLDNGVRTVQGKKFNFYGSFLFQRNWTNLALRAGACHLSERCVSDNRIKLDDTHKLTWYHKTLIRHNEFRFGVLGVFDLTNRVLLKKDFVLGYLKNQYQVYLKAEQDWKSPTTNWSDLKQYFTNVTATALYNKSNKETFGLEVALNPATQALSSATALVEYKHDFRSTLKAKLDHNTNLSLLLKRKLNNQSSVALGTSFALTDRSKNALKVGVELDLSI